MLKTSDKEGWKLLKFASAKSNVGGLAIIKPKERGRTLLPIVDVMTACNSYYYFQCNINCCYFQKIKKAKLEKNSKQYLQEGLLQKFLVEKNHKINHQQCCFSWKPAKKLQIIWSRLYAIYKQLVFGYNLLSCANKSWFWVK